MLQVTFIVGEFRLPGRWISSGYPVVGLVQRSHMDALADGSVRCSACRMLLFICLGGLLRGSLSLSGLHRWRLSLGHSATKRKYLLARIVVLLVIYLSWRRCAYSWTSCAITRCREIMTPQLSIVKTRFAKASLRPRCARHRSWGATCLFPNRRAGTLSFLMVALGTHLPNGYVGRRAFPIEAEGRLADFVDWRIRLKGSIPGKTPWMPTVFFF